MLQIRSKLDRSAVVWHSSLSNENRNDLEQIQKSAVRCILGESYCGFEKALEKLLLLLLFIIIIAGIWTTRDMVHRHISNCINFFNIFFFFCGIH